MSTKGMAMSQIGFDGDWQKRFNAKAQELREQIVARARELGIPALLDDEFAPTYELNVMSTGDAIFLTRRVKGHHKMAGRSISLEKARVLFDRLNACKTAEMATTLVAEYAA